MLSHPTSIHRHPFNSIFQGGFAGLAGAGQVWARYLPRPNPLYLPTFPLYTAIPQPSG